MKSFNEHTNVKREELKEDPLDDLTDLLWIAGAGLGAYGLKKGWDKFGKDAVARLPFAPDKWKAAKIDREKERDDEKAKIAKTLAGPDDTEKAQAKLDKDKKKKDDASTKADAKALDYDKDEDGIITNPKDAEEYKKMSGKAPEGWVVDPEEKKKDPKTNRVITKAEFEKRKAEEPKTDSRKLRGNMINEKEVEVDESQELQAIMALDDAGIKADINRKGQVVIKKKDKKKAHQALEKSFKKGGWPPLKLEGVDEHKGTEPHKHPHEDEELDEASSKKARNKAADEIEAIADKGGAEAPTLFRLASKLRKGTHSTTGLKLSKKVTAILKVNGIKEDVQKQRTAYEVVSEARNRVAKNKPEWETENSRLS